MSMIRTILTGCCVITLTIGVAFAASTTVRFTGTITSTDANSVAISEVEVGDPVSGEFTFDSAATDEIPDPNAGLYESGSLNVSIGEFDYSAADNNISVTNDSSTLTGDPVDSYEVVSPFRDVSGPSLSGLPPAQIDIVLVDTDAQVFSGDFLPLSLELSDFEIVSEVPFGTTGGRLIFQSVTSGDFGEVRFEITSLSFEIGSSSSDVIVYPQLAVGGDSSVILLLTNQSDSPWAGGTETLLTDGSLELLETQIELAPGETRKLTLTGGDEVITTGLVIRSGPESSASDLAVSYFFNFSAGGVLYDSLGVAPGEAARRFTFPVERGSLIDTGVAIRRLPEQGTAPITLRLYDADGTEIRQAEPGSDFALQISEIFDNLPENFLGSVVAESTDDFYLVVIRLEAAGSSFQLTSVPARTGSQ